MNVEIFCERRSQGRVALSLGRLLGGRGVCKGVGHYFWGVCREQAAFARAWGIVFGAFAGARNACMIVFAADVRFFVNLNFMYIFIIIFEG